MTKEEVQAALKKLGELRQKEKELEAHQKAAVITASGKFAPELAALESEIEDLEEGLKAYAKAELKEVKSFKCPQGSLTLTVNPPKVVFDPKREPEIVEELAKMAPDLLCHTSRVSKAAVLAAAASEDRGLITLAELNGITVVQEDTVRIKV